MNRAALDVIGIAPDGEEFETSLVPCGSCTACCRDQFVPILPTDEPNRGAYLVREIEVGEHGTLEVLDHKPNGDCAHLGSGGCEIYDQRPTICRTYDCRKQFRSMSRTQRRQSGNRQIWAEARKRLGTLSALDIESLPRYKLLGTDRLMSLVRSRLK